MGYQENSVLVDNLQSDDHFNTQAAERALRLVDRGIFVVPHGAPMAYTDAPFRSSGLSPGQIHISAPSIYVTAIEMLDLRKGQSFLNIGSGSGYLNTMAGFFLGAKGRNHGVELFSNVVDHALTCTHMFFRQKFVSGYDWCIPEFVHGNAFELRDISKRYDRIYVGAQVDQNQFSVFSEMLKEGGIMIIPVKSERHTLFQRVKRTPEGFDAEDFMHVAFADLIHPDEGEYRPEHIKEALRRKRKLVEDPNNPNESVTEDLLALFKPRSLEVLATNVIRRLIADRLRRTHPIAITQKQRSTLLLERVAERNITRHQERQEHQQNMFWGGNIGMLFGGPAFDLAEPPPDFDMIDLEERRRARREQLNEVLRAHREEDQPYLNLQRMEEASEAEFNAQIRDRRTIGRDEEAAAPPAEEDNTAFMDELQREIEEGAALEERQREAQERGEASTSSVTGPPLDPFRPIPSLGLTSADLANFTPDVIEALRAEGARRERRMIDEPDENVEPPRSPLEPPRSPMEPPRSPLEDGVQQRPTPPEASLRRRRHENNDEEKMEEGEAQIEDPKKGVTEEPIEDEKKKEESNDEDKEERMEQDHGAAIEAIVEESEEVQKDEKEVKEVEDDDSMEYERIDPIVDEVDEKTEVNKEMKDEEDQKDETMEEDVNEPIVELANEDTETDADAGLDADPADAQENPLAFLGNGDEGDEHEEGEIDEDEEEDEEDEEETDDDPQIRQQIQHAWRNEADPDERDRIRREFMDRIRENAHEPGDRDRVRRGYLERLHELMNMTARRLERGEDSDGEDEYAFPPMTFNRFASIQDEVNADYKRRRSCKFCQQLRCKGKCREVPKLSKLAARITGLHPSYHCRVSKSSPSLTRLSRLGADVKIVVRSFAEEMSGVLAEPIGEKYPNGHYAIEDWVVLQRRQQFEEEKEAHRELVRELGTLQFEQEQCNFEELRPLAESTLLAKMKYKNQEESVRRFEGALVEFIDQLPISSLARNALKWNLYRSS